MIKTLLLVSGFLLLILQQFLPPASPQLQFIIFLTGIILLGVPHGAADLMVATQQAADKKHVFKRSRFFVEYLSRLLLFALILWLFPLAGNILFIFFAAYHFGETDLCQFKTNTIAGKLFVISYGLVILGVILLHHFEDVQPLLQQFDAAVQYASVINFIAQYRYTMLSILGVLFFATTFFYFSINKQGIQIQGQFLVQFALILFILYNLPMMMGFTFYFICWHSLLSLRNIVHYLGRDGLFSTAVIVKQISIYSLLAMAGIVLFGLSGFMFVSNDAMLMYIVLGLAVLTAPHMQIMHDMYTSVRTDSTNRSETS